MDERDAFSRATLGPAGVLGMAGEIGTLRTGACADLAVLEWDDGALPLADVAGRSGPEGATRLC